MGIQKTVYNNYERESVIQKYRSELEKLSKEFPRSPYPESYFFELNKRILSNISRYTRDIVLHLTNRCNMFCNICYKNSSPYRSSNSDISLEEVKMILSHIKKKKNFILFGGEPTIREDLPEIIKEIKSHGHRVEIYTNGILLSRKSFARKIKQLGVDRIYLSFSGFDKRVNALIYGNSIYLKYKLRALKNLRKLRIEVVLSSIIGKNVNEDEIPNILKLVYSKFNNGFLKGINFYGITGYGRFLLSKTSLMDTVNLLHEIETRTDGKISFEYLLEFKRLLLNLFKRKVINHYSSGALIGAYILEDDEYKEILPVNTLKIINKMFLKGKNKLALAKLATNIIRNVELMRALSFIKNDFVTKDINKMFFVSVANIHTPVNFNNRLMLDTIDIEKDEAGIRMLVSGGESSYFGTDST